MELTVSVVFGLFSILHSLTAGISAEANADGHVLFCSEHNQNFKDIDFQQYLTKYMKREDEARGVDGAREASVQKTKHEIELTKDGSKYLIVECLEYENEAIAFLYSKERFLVVKLELQYSKDVCKQVGDYISLDKKKEPQITVKPEYDMLEFTIMYWFPWDGCYTKRYKIITYFYVAILRRFGKKSGGECEKHSVTVAAGAGVFKDLTWGSFEIMDYTEGSPVGEPIIKSLTDDPDYPYQLKCQKYTNEGKHKNAIKDSTMYSALIMYRNKVIGQYQVVDRFFLDSCPTKDVGIYVKDTTDAAYDPTFKIFVILFRTKDGKCFLRRVMQNANMDIVHYVSRKPPVRVKCRDDWANGSDFEYEELNWLGKMVSLFKTVK